MITAIRAAICRPRVCVGASVLAAAALAGACAHRDRGSEDAAAGSLIAAEAHSDYGMVSTGSVEATRAGARILENGGNAVDAAVAAAFALGVADPGGSGLGGMTYVLISPANGNAIAVDGSATVPVAADRAAMLELQESEQFFGAKAVAVPATLAALSRALARHGTMDLKEVLAPAIEIAERGYRLSSNSIVWARGYFSEIAASRYLRFIVLENGERLGTAGDLICRPDLAATLRELADDGPNAFYRGSIGRRMLMDLVKRGAYLQPIDLMSARATEMQPLISSYRGAEVISYPWPGGGGEVSAALDILQNFSPEFLREESVESLHVLVESFRIAHADYLRSAQNPMQRAAGANQGLSQARVRQRAALITPGRAIPEEELGTAVNGPRMGEHTTHLSVADRWGNAVAMTQTLCRQYGAKVATPGLGFPYNSCLEFFDFENPESPYYLRPRGQYASNMAPTIIRDAGRLMILGSAGSDRIAGSVVTVTSNVIDRGMSLRDAVAAPRVLWNSAHDPQRLVIEIGDPITEEDADRLKNFGFEHQFRLVTRPTPADDSAFFGGVNAVLYDSSTGVFSGVGDPRRYGFALGPRTVAQRGEEP